jgi:hypothetical protein
MDARMGTAEAQSIIIDCPLTTTTLTSILSGKRERLTPASCKFKQQVWSFADMWLILQACDGWERLEISHCWFVMSQAVKRNPFDYQDNVTYSGCVCLVAP